MKSRLVLAASLASGLAAAILTQAYIASKENDLATVKERFKREYGEMEALCFNRDIASGSIISLADLSLVKTYRKGNEGSVLTAADSHDITGRRTIGFHRKGEPLRWNDIEGGEPNAAGLAAKVATSLRAMSISVNSPAAVSGHIRPGDTVDVIGTFDFPDGDGAGKKGEAATCTVLQNVHVLAKDNATVTLAVTPREAEMLAFAEHIKGRLVLTLRNRNDIGTEDALPTVDFSRIRDQIERLNRLRNPHGRKNTAR